MSKKKGSKNTQTKADTLIIRAIGEELRRARQEKGWSIRILAGRMDMPVNTYACYELGTRACPTHRLAEICRTLGVKPGELLDLALQRIETELHASGLSIDLDKLAATDHDLPSMLRQWAKNHLALAPDDSSVIQLNHEVIKEMATLLGLTIPNLGNLLREFSPESALRQ
ncbi:MAG TPA: helix-turn-helix transcriptional regulator [Candidatus Saccharimonadales bacterium]